MRRESSDGERAPRGSLVTRRDVRVERGESRVVSARVAHPDVALQLDVVAATLVDRRILRPRSSLHVDGRFLARRNDLDR